MVTIKKTNIKTADFEASYRHLVKEISEMEHTPKTAILRLLEDFRSGCIETEEPKFEIIKELRV